MLKRSIRATALAAGIVLVGVAGAVGLSSANAAVVGHVTLLPATGGSGSVISMTTQGPCAAPAVKVRAIAQGFGFQASGQIIYSPQTVGFSTTDPMTLAVSNAFVVYATNNSTALVGDYDIKVQCVNSLGSVIYDEYSTVMTWTTPGNSLANIDQATYTSGVTAPPTTTPPTTGPPTTTPPPTTTAPPTTTPPAAPLPVRVTSPALSGAVKVGLTVTCKPGVWTNSPTFTYQWLRAGAVIAGSTATTRKLVAADYNKLLSCRVTAKNAGGSVVATTPAVKVALGVFKLVKAPYMTGTFKVGKTLAFYKGTWSPSPSVFAYQWLRAGKSIKGATGTKYKLTTADRGKYVSLKVTVKVAGYAPASKVTASKKVS